jgi:hypothetical protein
MRTLRELGEFVGLPQDSAEFGAPVPPIGLRLVSKLIAPVSTAQQRASMRSIVDLLRTLPPISLEAQLLNPGGTEPYVPVIRVTSSPALVISTRIHYIESGNAFPSSRNFGAEGGDFSPTTLAPGQWDIVVRRAGIGNTGYVRLSKAFHTTVTRAERPPDNRPSPSPPHISVEHSGPANAVRFVVTGTNFLKNQPPPPSSDCITVRVVGVPLQDWALLYTSSDSAGKIRLETNPLDTGLLNRNALGQASITFSATDKRKDPNSVPANEPLWSNTVSFTF